MDEQTVQTIKKTIERSCLPDIKIAVVGGSCTLPYIDHPHDIDVCVYVDPIAQPHRLAYVRGLRSSLKETVGEDVSLITRATSKWWVENGLLRRDAFMNDPRFAKSVIGDITDLIPTDEVDVFANKDRYIESLKAYYLSEKFAEHTATWGRLKAPYQAFLLLYFLDNGSYELTEEQRKNVNIVHDCADGYEELRDWLLERLNSM